LQELSIPVTMLEIASLWRLYAGGNKGQVDLLTVKYFRIFPRKVWGKWHWTKLYKTVSVPTLIYYPLRKQLNFGSRTEY